MRIQRMFAMFCLYLVFGAGSSHKEFFANTAVAGEARPRLLVLTDIGGDPDDQQSMVRLMLYANEFEIEGLIASASGTPGELKEAVTKPQLIREIVDAYGQVRDNLALHSDRYPTADWLRTRIKSGNPQRGLDALGEGHDTEGSRWIISTVDREDPRPLNITIWGGQTDLAQALWRVRADRGNVGLKQFIDRIRIYDIGDQDRIVGVHSHSAHQVFNVFWAFSRSGVCVQALELIGWGSQRQSDRPS